MAIKHYSIEKALNLLRDYIDGTGGCDHDVNICVCFDYMVLDNALGEINSLREENLRLKAMLVDEDYAI